AVARQAAYAVAVQQGFYTLADSFCTLAKRLLYMVGEVRTGRLRLGLGGGIVMVIGFVAAHACNAEGVPECLRDKGTMCRQRFIELRACHAHGFGQPFALRGIARQQVRLLVLAILQHMFYASQEFVSLGQSRGDVIRDDTRLVLFVQCRQQATLLKRRRAPAAYELVQLHNEFDFTYAAFSQLDVVYRIDTIADGGTTRPVQPNSFAQPPKRC